ncbi:hypothetical protein QYZ87_08400 [Porphyromonadaceae bacterium W3.11]|nr:hypothetical protein [Porphyromonadaceae bacterium W3.11]
MKRIFVTQEQRKELVKTFGVRFDTLSKALNYKTDSELSKKIRALAVQKGGYIVGDDYEMETIFRSNGDMVQSWGGFAQIIAYKCGKVKVFIEGKLDKEVPSMTVNELMREQNRISTLIASR